MATATDRLRLSPDERGRIMSLDDYLDAEVQPGFRYELARGVLEATKTPRDPHAVVVFNFYCALSDYHRNHPNLIYRFGGAGEFHFILPVMISGRNPDVAVVLQGTPKDPRGLRPASFAVEVVSKGKRARERDYVTKRQEYLVYGLREYWIVDPELRQVTILLREGDAWSERLVRDEQSAESLALPGLIIPLEQLWPEEGVE